MVAKFVALLALVAVASASDFSSFEYSVADPYTGDFKNQIESRAGSNVQGQYSLLESDGTRRTVDYAAGAGGFNAVVRKDPALIAAAPIARLPIAPLPVAPLPIAPLPVARLPVAPLPVARLPVAPLPIAPLPIAPLPVAPLPIAPIAPYAGLGAYAGRIIAPSPYARYY